MSFKIRLLDNTHKKERFDCQNNSLNDYLQKQAKQDVKRSLAACYVLLDANDLVKGYYTLSSASIPRSDLAEELANKLPRSYESLPATLLGRLAIDKSLKGQGMGKALLYSAVKRAYENTEAVASMAVVVDPIDDNAKAFYLHYGFIDLPGSGRMFLPMKTIRELVGTDI